MSEVIDLLINQFDNYINNEDNKNYQVENILDFEKGFINFDVSFLSIHNQQIQINFQDKQSLVSPIYYKGHYGPLQEHKMYEDLQLDDNYQLQRETFQLVKRQESFALQHELIQNEQMIEDITKEITNQIQQNYNQDVSLKQKNCFASSFTFNIINGEFIQSQANVIEPQFKQFSFETDKVLSKQKVSLSQRAQQDKLVPFNELQAELSQLSIPINEQVGMKQNLSQIKDIYEKIEQNHRLIQILSLYDMSLQNTSTSKQNPDEKLSQKNQLQQPGTNVWSKLITNSKNKDQQQIQKGNELSDIYSLPSNLESILSKIIKEDEYENEQQQKEEQRLRELTDQELKLNYDIQAQQAQYNLMMDKNKQIESKFKIIRLVDIQQGKGNKYSSHQWAVEDESDLSNFYDQLPREKFVLQYEFELDDFQKRAILHLEKKESVLVCAHTSAGKTVVAEYAIALSKKHKKRIVYTSPIKALSNEKFRKFSQKFGDVGILTGDANINVQASCLIMTTEILRNMLYRGHDMIRDIEWVVFDEVHYVNDEQRGVVWEETIIMLPEHIGIIMLSATVPNYLDFANWVGRTKKRQIYVQKTFMRPVPLEHSIYIFNKFQLIKDKNGKFLASEYEHLLNSIVKAQQEQTDIVDKKAKDNQEKMDKGFFKDNKDRQKLLFAMKQINQKFIKKVSKGDLSNPMHRDEKRNVIELIRHCQKEDMLPCVFFIFSKAKINELAEGLLMMDLISKADQSKVIRYFDKAMKRLKPQDQFIPQLLYLKELLKKGIAVHHGDLLPIAKEVVEILFSEGLVRVLLATETFAMGINMPTKTVIFWSLKKNDGQSFRYLNSSEYTQMSGRAGRRGIDEKGNIVIFFKDPQHLPTKVDMTKIIDHKGEQLLSKFKITYSIILNKLNSKDLTILEMMRQSFCENSKYNFMPGNKLKIKQFNDLYTQYSKFDCPFFAKSALKALPIEDYYQKTNQLRNINKQYFMSDISFLKQLAFPKLVAVLGLNNIIDLGLLLGINVEPKKPFDVMIINPLEQGEKKKKIVLEYEETKREAKTVKDKNYVYRIVDLHASEILEIFQEKTNISQQKGVKQEKGYSHTYLQDAANFLIDKKPHFDEIYLYNKDNPKHRKLFNKYNINAANNLVDQQKNDQGEEGIGIRVQKDSISGALISSNCHTCQLKFEHIDQIQQKIKVKKELQELIKSVDEDQLNLKGNLDGMIRVLKNLKYIDENDMPLLKVSIAKELGENQIYICELILENVLQNLNYAEFAGLLSGFVCQFKNKERQQQQQQLQNNEQFAFIYDDEEFSDQIKIAIENTYKICLQIAQEEEQQKVLQITAEEHLDNILNFELIKVVYMWALGFEFSQICEITTVQEGAIVRTILRLENLLSNFKNAAKIIGNMQLYEIAETSRLAISRDIVFAESLYLQQENNIFYQEQNQIGLMEQSDQQQFMDEYYQQF